jgi:hypothetical protein
MIRPYKTILIFASIDNGCSICGWGYDLYEAVEVGCRVPRVMFATDVVLQGVLPGVQITANLAFEFNLNERFFLILAENSHLLIGRNSKFVGFLNFVSGNFKKNYENIVAKLATNCLIFLGFDICIWKNVFKRSDEKVD